MHVAVLLGMNYARGDGEWRQIDILRRGVTARPAAVRHGADIKRHAQTVAGVERHAAHTHHVPARAEILRAHLRVRLEAATGEHNRLRIELHMSLRRERLHTCHPPVGIPDEINRSGFIMKLRAEFFQDGAMPLLQTPAATVWIQNIFIPLRTGYPVVAFRRQPMHGLQRFGDVHLQHVLIRLIIGHPHHLIPHIGLGAARQTFE